METHDCALSCAVGCVAYKHGVQSVRVPPIVRCKAAWDDWSLCMRVIKSCLVGSFNESASGNANAVASVSTTFDGGAVDLEGLSISSEATEALVAANAVRLVPLEPSKAGLAVGERPGGALMLRCHSIGGTRSGPSTRAILASS